MAVDIALPEMTPTLLIFFMVSLKLVMMTVGVIAARNPIYSVLFLIAAFLNTSVIFLLAGAEFLALILAIVYVGAVAILFLFVVMMFDVNFDRVREHVGSFWLLATGSGLFFLTELVAVIWVWKSYDRISNVGGYSVSEEGTNTAALGSILYTDYFLAFQLSGMILFIAMIGAITLALNKKNTFKHQNLDKQLERSPSNTLRLIKVKSKQGFLQ